MRLTMLVAGWALAAAACTTDDAPGEPAAPAEDETGAPAPEGEETPPPNGWVNTPIPFVAYHHEVTVAFAVHHAGAGPREVVVGLGDGRVRAAADLGPMVRLGPDGRLEARDGGAYRADADVRYGDAPVALALTIDLAQHTYSVDADGVRLATDYAFNADQAALFRIDTLAARTETAGATVELRDVEVGPEFCSVAATSWVNLFHPEHLGTFRVQFDAEVPSTAIDATIGVAGEDSVRISDLAATLRFTPNGTFAAGNAGSDSADRAIPYAAYARYRVTFEIDVPAKRYSVYVSPKSERGAGQLLAASYAFRPEQSEAFALSQVGMFTTGAGYIRLCNLQVWDY